MSDAHNLQMLLDAFLAIWPAAIGGPAFHVFMDLDMEHDTIVKAFCDTKESIVDGETIYGSYFFEQHSHEELKATTLFLGLLLVIPEKVRNSIGVNEQFPAADIEWNK